MCRARQLVGKILTMYLLLFIKWQQLISAQWQIQGRTDRAVAPSPSCGDLA